MQTEMDLQTHHITRKTRPLTNVTNQVSLVCCYLAGWVSNLQFLSSNWISYIRSKAKAHGWFPGDGASVSWIAEVGDNQSYVPVCPHSLTLFVQLSFSTANPYLQSLVSHQWMQQHQFSIDFFTSSHSFVRSNHSDKPWFHVTLNGSAFLIRYQLH